MPERPTLRERARQAHLDGIAEDEKWLLWNRQWAYDDFSQALRSCLPGLDFDPLGWRLGKDLEGIRCRVTVERASITVEGVQITVTRSYYNGHWNWHFTANGTEFYGWEGLHDALHPVQRVTRRIRSVLSRRDRKDPSTDVGPD